MQEVKITTLCGICGSFIIEDKRYNIISCSKQKCPQYNFSIETGSKILEEVSIVCPVCFSATVFLSILGTQRYICLNPKCSCYTISIQNNQIDISYRDLLLFSLYPNKNNILEVVYCYVFAKVSGKAKQTYKKLIQGILRILQIKEDVKLTALEQSSQFKMTYFRNRRKI